MLFSVEETNRYMDAFCNSTLWNTTLTWYQDTPDFTPCFKRSVLVWIPCFFLWSCLPFEVYTLKNSKSRDIPLTMFNINKLTSCIILITLSVVHFVRNVLMSDSSTLVDIYSPVIQFFTFILFLTLTWMNFKMGIRSSGSLFTFTLLLVICGAPELRGEIIIIQNLSAVYEEQRLQFILYTVYYATVLLSFFLNCFVDPKPRYVMCSNVPSRNKENPEENASFCSRLYYCWFDRVVWKAYKEPLRDDDFWDLDQEYTSAVVVPKFEKRWNALIEKNKKLEISTNVSSNRASENKYEVEYRTHPQKSSSFVVPLFRIYLLQYVVIMFYLLVENGLLFVSPQVLNSLISFVSGDEPSWKGYVYSALLLVTALGQSLILSIYNTKLLLIQMVVRSTMVEIVYKKTLKISNQARKNFTTGEIVNLMSSDIRKFTNIIWNFNVIWSAPFQIIGVFYFLWTILGPSAFTGIIVILALIPLNSYLSSNLKILQRLRLKHKDRRIRIMSEILTGIKVIKLYAWENNFEKQIQDIRSEELRTLRKQIGLNITLILLWNIIPYLISLVTFATYVLSSDQHVLDPQKVFVSVSLFNILKNPMSMLPQVVSEMMQAGVSITRINKFLNAEELDHHAVTHKTNVGSLAIKNGTFSWTRSDESPQLEHINLEIKQGALVAIVGPVGSGKSSLISAFLGEMYKLTGTIDTKGSIAYVPQISWIRNTTLRENITLGFPIEESFYKTIIESCALTHDLKILPGGDLTEIGEKGINLSGGQKQRVSLARAICSEADIYFLDDPLSAVDAHVGNHIFQHVLGPGGMLENRTRVMTTHSTTFLAQADLIVVMKNGTISEIGTLSQLLNNNGSFADFLRNYSAEKVIESAANEMDSNEVSVSSKKFKTKDDFLEENKTEQECGFSKIFVQNEAVTKPLIKKEHVETGYVKGKVYQHFISSVGIFFPIATIAMFFCLQSVIVSSNFWLSKWSTDESVSQDGIQLIDKRNYYLGYYAFFGLLQAIFTICGNCILFIGFLRASSNMHEKLVSKVLKWPLRIFNVTPLGRILNRFGYDIDVVDYTLAMKSSKLLLKLGMIISTLVVVSYTTPPFIFICIILLILFRLMQKFYLATSQQLKRMESNSRSPIYSHFAETVAGLESIRAYGLQDKFISLSREKVDFNQTRVYTSIIATRWSTLRLEIIANMVVFFSSLFAVIYRYQLDAGLVGVSVSYSLQITKGFSWLMRNLTEIETLMVAVERIKEFEEYPIEAAWNLLPKNLPNNWPHSGEIQLFDYKLRYDKDLDLVLKGLTFSVKGGEKVGIVGRTGAGKSSLALGLFRILEPAGGNIFIDGVDICSVGLHNLRSRLSIIPQDPALFSGTLRVNLDPFENYCDESIWNVLEQTRLKKYFSAMPDGLHYIIDEGGINLSVGQRQLICLARALLRKSKILILDEATAAIDLETDELIQTTIRREFRNHTVLTIAHRLNTIMDYDRILVLKDGSAEDYDTPQALLEKKTSFYEWAREAGLI